MENILEVKNLTKKFTGFFLNGVSFSLEKGYIMGLIGPNGAGKTTTIKLIMNLLKRDSGEIRVFGEDNLAREKAIKDRIGFVYEENNFYEELTLAEITRIVAPLYKRWDDNVYNRYIKDFELPVRKKIKQLSKGMRTKFFLALALSHHAELLIMDEPTAGLDPVFRRELLDILRDFIGKENRGVLFSTHITSDLDKVADYITFLYRGRVIMSRSREELLEQYALVKGEKRLLTGDLRALLTGVQESSFGFEGLTKDAAQVRRMWGEKLVIERPALEDIMLYTIRGEKHV